MTIDEETVLETADVPPPDKRVRFWHRIGVTSTGMILFSVTAVPLRLVLISILHDKSEPGLFSRCLGMAALASFAIGTFLADLWVLHALVKGQEPGQARSTTRMNPISSLLLTGRLHSQKTENVQKDILSAKTLLVLFLTIISVLLLMLLWTRK